MLVNNMLNYHSKSIDVADQYNDIQSIVELALSIIDDNIEIADIEDEDSNSVKLANTWICHSLPQVEFFTLPIIITYPYMVGSYQSITKNTLTPPPEFRYSRA